MATSESSSEAIIRRYAAAMNLGPAHTVLFLAASVGVTCCFLAPLMTGFGPLPPWLFWVAPPWCSGCWLPCRNTSWWSPSSLAWGHCGTARS
jgi:hypothetical protein